MRAVTLGPAGTYSHRAARAVADEVSFRESVTGIVDAVADGEFERGVVPIENSIEGSVTESLDALAGRDVAVVAEIVTPIRHALLAQSEDFSVVASHSQALAQCRTYLESEYPNVRLEAVTSTARGVERARQDPSVAGIGHPDNAEPASVAGEVNAEPANAGEVNADSASADGELTILAEDIQDRSSNATRFLVVAPASERSEAGGKTSLVVYPNANYPGLLLELLEAFADRDINLSRIESRPSGDRLGDYLFHIDFEAGLYEPRAKEALADVEEIARNGWVRRLGSYDTRHVLY
ncbi:prephenate dehydratase [Halegenticoccus tardaugens]|uniref:prephenate dehydratase n=1 Tax=Halegenticoccus tardaugens TaxID=2071624 RepID=UPI00100B9362|nr:prephenate dehydratase domain-containing protein [Halegenticoccus tardaugens]